MVDLDPCRTLGGTQLAGSGLSWGSAGLMSGRLGKSMSCWSSKGPFVENSRICRTTCDKHMDTHTCIEHMLRRGASASTQDSCDWRACLLERPSD